MAEDSRISANLSGVSEKIDYKRSGWREITDRFFRAVQKADFPWSKRPKPGMDAESYERIQQAVSQQYERIHHAASRQQVHPDDLVETEITSAAEDAEAIRDITDTVAREAEIQARLVNSLMGVDESETKPSWRDGREDQPVNVEAPIVMDVDGENGVDRFLNFVAGLEQHGNMPVAIAEAQRIRPYFEALSDYAHQAQKARGGPLVDDGYSSPEELSNRKNLRETTSPQALTSLFVGIAEQRKNTLLSDIVFLPDDITEIDNPAQALFEGIYNYFVSYHFNGKPMSFGFIQAYEGGDKSKAKSSVTIPIVTLDTDMMKAVKSHQPEKMMQILQNVFSYANHDMLHHYTTAILNRWNPEVAQNFQGKAGYSSNPIDSWTAGRLTGIMGYETWAQIAHEQILLGDTNSKDIDHLKTLVDVYFDEVGRIAADISVEGQDKVHEVTDYYGTVMAHALTRILPLDHPVMLHCFDRMEEVDPQSGQIAQTTRFDPITMFGMFKAIDEQRDNVTVKKDPVASLRKAMKRHNDIEGGYKAKGFDLVPESEDDIGYRHYKIYQLIEAAESDISPHMPPQNPDDMQSLQRKQTGIATLSMLEAVAIMTDYHAPKNPNKKDDKDAPKPS